jgi:hypothetical protein
LGFEVEESLEIGNLFLRSLRTLELKILSLGHLEELTNLYCQIFVEKLMMFFGFRLPFRPSLVRLCRRHPRGESEGIFKWVLPMAGVKKFFIGHPMEKTSKTRKMNLKW